MSMTDFEKAVVGTLNGISESLGCLVLVLIAGLLTSWCAF